MTRAEGWQGWDEYAPFYDWENARTMGRQDVRFWQDLARREGGPVLELGCGTGRIDDAGRPDRRPGRRDRSVAPDAGLRTARAQTRARRARGRASCAATSGRCRSPTARSRS